MKVLDAPSCPFERSDSYLSVIACCREVRISWRSKRMSIDLPPKRYEISPVGRNDKPKKVGMTTRNKALNHRIKVCSGNASGRQPSQPPHAIGFLVFVLRLSNLCTI